MLIYEKSQAGRRSISQAPLISTKVSDIPEGLLRKKKAALAEVSEMQVVRHYTNLSRRNFSIDTQFYPLGSCTMKYNPKINENMA
ncbi:MAG: hypothetical protein KUG73_11340, partial [Pseudomonadales bacterium]|nr:hypothetical protein [Pseudomonadales bacterium]